ncbi:hypothetical protein AC579_781 [Pseudocercospora musae]|uniref:Uncharacterized protein n=1 Tax=Pseudocercospora musae TaxID=113226 RepID=A0A139IH63_9PEZI|nr:hypothetical protein AC579_781 [Pseudocercospora musae]
MADFTASRCMDDFFINPTIALDRLFTQPTMPGPKLRSSSIAGIEGEVYRKAAASIIHLVNEPVSWPGYASEEEAVSPIYNDSASLRSMPSFSSVCSLPESLAEASAQSSQRCIQAKAIKIQTVGRPRVVSMPKSPTRSAGRPYSSSSMHSKQQSVSLPTRDSSLDFFQSARTSQESQSRSRRHSSISSSTPRSPASTAPSSIDDDSPLTINTSKKVFSRHIDLMEAASALSPTISNSAPLTPILPRSATFNESSTSSRRQSKLVPIRGPTFSAIKNLMRRDSVDVREDMQEPELAGVTRDVSQPSVQSGSTSINRPKMIARAANERAPPIKLPPCPDEYDSGPEFPRRKRLQARQRRMSIPLI